MRYIWFLISKKRDSVAIVGPPRRGGGGVFKMDHEREQVM